MDKKVTVYSTPTCHYCHLVKDFLNQNHIKFEDFDVASDFAKRQEMVDKSGQMGVPVIIVGEEIIVGFNQPLLENLLEIKN